MSLHPYVQPPEEELYYERVESVDTVRRDAAAAVLDAIHVARFLASRYFAPGVESVAADAHLYAAVCALERAEVRS